MRLIALIARHPRRAAAAALIAALVALPFALGVGIDNSIETWLDRDGSAFRTYDEFLERFGSEEFLLLVYDLPAPLDEDFLLELTDLRLDLEEIDGVRLAIDPSSMRAKFFGGSAAAGFEGELRGSPFYRDFLISGDGARAATWVALDIDNPAARGTIVEDVETAVRRRWPGREVHLAGPPVLNATLDRYSRRAARTLFPLVFTISGLLLLYRFRRLSAVVVPFVSVGSGIAVTLALMNLAGRSLDMVTAVLPSVLWVLGLSSSIHLLSCFRRRLASGDDRQTAALSAMLEVARPCLFSAITTALGFLALLASDMQPVQEMGLFAALGILLCLMANFALFPFLARLGKTPAPPAPEAASGIIRRWPIRRGAMTLGAIGLRRPAAVLIAVVVLTVLLGGAMTRIRAESNVIEFFKDDAPITHTYHSVLPGVTGSFSLEILLTPPVDPIRLETFGELERLQTLIAAVPGVAKVFSPVDLLKKMHQVSTGSPPEVWELPRDEADFSLAWDMTERSLEQELELLFDAASGQVRLSVLAHHMASDDHQRMVVAIRDILSRQADPAWDARLTGIVDLVVEMQIELVRSQIRSFALAFLLIGPVIALLLRSPRYAFLSLPPNLLPILVALGTMGAVGIRLDPATVMTAAIALGIAVDDTIHFLARYQMERARTATSRPALERTLDAVAEPIADTSLIAAAGFLVLCFSDFVPLIYFGLLTSLALLAALFADLLVLPALLTLTDRSAE